MTTLRQAAEQSQPDLWTKGRLAAEKIVLCLRGADLADGQYGAQWEVRYFAVANKHRMAQKMWFASTSDDKDRPATRWDEMFENTSEWPEHNVLLAFNTYKKDGTPDVQKGYHLEFLERTPGQCPCSQFRVVEAAPKVKVIAAPVDPEVDDILVDMGFDTPDIQPLTDATRHRLLLGSAALKAQTGVIVDPGDVETMTEAQGQQRLLQLRQQWQSGSAIMGTDKL